MAQEVFDPLSPAKPQNAGYVAVLEIQGLVAEEYNSIVARMDVERNPAAGIYLHIAAPMENGIRVVELWDTKEGFEQYIQEQLIPACTALGIQKETTVSITPLYNLFAPRLQEIPQIRKTKTQQR